MIRINAMMEARYNRMDVNKKTKAKAIFTIRIEVYTFNFVPSSIRLPPHHDIIVVYIPVDCRLKQRLD